MWWMGLTWACLCLPSVVGITAAVVRAIKAAASKSGDFERKWDEFVNPIAFYASFPVSSVIWSVGAQHKGLYSLERKKPC